MMAMLVLLLTMFCCPPAAPAQDLGNLSANPFAFDSTANAFRRGKPVRAKRNQ